MAGIFLVRIRLRQKYYAPQVWSYQGSNPLTPAHSPFHVLEKLVLATKPGLSNCYEPKSLKTDAGNLLPCDVHVCHSHLYNSLVTWLGALLLVNSYSASHDNWCTATLWNRIMTAQCEGMGEVGSARYEPALLPPCPSIRVLCYSNCQRSIQSHQQFKG